MHQSLTNQIAGNFEDNGTDIALREEVLAILKCVRIEPIFVADSVLESVKGSGVTCKQIRRQTGKSRNPRVCLHHLVGMAGDNDFALRAPLRVVFGGSPNLDALHMLSFVAVRMGNSTELNLERYFFTRVAIEIKAKSVEPLAAEGIRRGNTGIRIHRHRHYRRTRTAAKQIEVTGVHARIVFGRRRIKVVRHN